MTTAGRPALPSSDRRDDTPIQVAGVRARRDLVVLDRVFHVLTLAAFAAAAAGIFWVKPDADGSLHRADLLPLVPAAAAGIGALAATLFYTHGTGRWTRAIRAAEVDRLRRLVDGSTGCPSR